MLVAISKSLVIYEANPNDIATTATVAPITKPTQGAACEGDTRVRCYYNILLTCHLRYL